MKDKRLIVLKSIAFLVTLSVTLNLLSNVFTPKHMAGSIMDEPSDTLDYIVIGDSESYTSISPMELWQAYGYTGYNCGGTAQRIQDTYYHLEKVLQRQSPKVVLMETNLLHRNQGCKQVVEKIANHIAGKMFSLYDHHNEWKNLLFPKKEDKNALYEKNVLKGWRYNTGVLPYIGGPYTFKTNHIEKINSMQLLYMDKIVELCKERDIQLILFCVPSPVNWNYQKHNAVVEYAAEKKLPFLDLNLKTEKLAIDWAQDTYDKGDHLNFFGAMKVTRYIGAYLYQNAALIDHRKDSIYAAWSEKLPAYLKVTGQKGN